MDIQPNENNTKDIKLYSQRSIAIATFFGSPMAAGYLIRENFINLNEPKKGNKSLVIGIIATILIFVGIFMLPDEIINKIPNQILPALYILIIYFIVEKIHGEILKQHEKNGNQFFSAWKAVGIGIVSLIILLIVIFGTLYFSTNTAEVEKYDNELADFYKNEEECLVFYDHLRKKSSNSVLIDVLNNSIPKWEENIRIINHANKINNLQEEYLEQNKILLKYAELRLKAFQLFKKALTDKNTDYTQELDKIHLEINNELNKLKSINSIIQQ